MSKIISYITNANGNLTKQKDLILQAVKDAEEYVFPRLKVEWDIDVVITNRLENLVIPEDGVGGYTYAADFITMGLDEKKFTKNFLTEMLVHELCHAARWGINDEWMNSLFDGIISEGIATYFEVEFAKNQDKMQYFSNTIIHRTDKENARILSLLKNKMDNEKYDYQTIFIVGDDKLPRWSGYSLGYYLVKKYLEKTNKTIEEAFADKYDDFKIILC